MEGLLGKGWSALTTGRSRARLLFLLNLDKCIHRSDYFKIQALCVAYEYWHY